MEEAYSIGIKIAITDNKLFGAINDMVAGFERANEALKQMRTNVGGLDGELSRAARRAGNLADEMERARRASEGINVGGMGGGGRRGGGGGGGIYLPPPLPAENGPLRLGYDGDEPFFEPERGGRGGGRRPGGGGGGGGGGRSPRQYGGGMDFFADAYIADQGFDFFKSIFGSSAEAGGYIAKMQAAGFTPDQIARSKALALSTMKSTPGAGYAETLNLINQTAAFTGDPNEAMALTPGLARNAQVLSLYGHGNAIDEIEKAAKAGELTGLTRKDGSMDTAKLTSFVSSITRTMVASGGTLNLGQYLTGVRQFGAGADVATTDFMTNILPAYMQIMGSSRAGTALQSLQQSLLSTRPNTQNKSIVKEQIRLGLRQRNGHLSAEDADLLSSDPNAYMVERILPALQKHGYSDPRKIRTELSKFLPRNTMERLVAAGIFDEGVINKEADKYRAQQARGDAPLDNLLSGSPDQQKKAFNEAFKGFETSLGDAFMPTAIKILHGLTDGLNGVAKFAREHPDGMSKVLTGLAIGFSAIGAAGVIGALSLLAGPAGLLASFGAAIYGVAEACKGAVTWLKQEFPALSIGRDKFQFDPSGNRIHPDRRPYNPAEHGSFMNFFFGGGQRSDNARPAPPSVQPVQFMGQLVTPDGQKLGEFAAKSMVKSMGGGASHGMSGFDPSMSPMPSGAGVMG